MRTILGCAKTTRIEIMVMELNLPSTHYRIKELTIAAIIRMTKRNDKTLIPLFNTCQTAHTLVKVNRYGKKLCKTLLEYDAVQYCTCLKKSNSVPPWLQDKIKVL